MTTIQKLVLAVFAMAVASVFAVAAEPPDDKSATQPNVAVEKRGQGMV
jgi:hypothetical protein